MRALIRAIERLLGGRCCRVCGCTTHAACAGGCSWVASDLCSACEDELLEEITGGCPGGGVDDLCAYAQGLDPFEDGCGLCTLGMNPELLR